MKLPSYKAAALTVAGVGTVMVLTGVAATEQRNRVASTQAEAAKAVNVQQERDDQVQSKLSSQEAQIETLTGQKDAACAAVRTAIQKAPRAGITLPQECL